VLISHKYTISPAISPKSFRLLPGAETGGMPVLLSGKMKQRFLGLIALAFLTAAPAAAQNWQPDLFQFLQARLASERGDFGTAIAMLDQLIERDPTDPILRYERAMMQLDAGRIDRAELELRQIVRSSPDFYDAQRLLGRVLLDRSRGRRDLVDEAVRHLQEAIRLNPHDLPTGMTVVQVLISSERMEEGEELLALLAERFPDQRVVNYNYAQLLTRLGRPLEARPFLERLAANDPTFGPGVLQLIDIYQQQGEWALAAEALDPLVATDPENLDLRRQQGYFYLRAGESELALARFEELLAAEPDDKRHHFFYAEALTDTGEYARSEPIYRKLIADGGADPEVLVSLGLNLMAQRKFDEAAEIFRQLLGLARLPAGVISLAQTQLASIEHHQGTYDSALERALEVIRGPRGLNPQAVSLALDVYRRQGKFDEGAAMLAELAAEFPDEAAIVVRRIEFLTLAGREADADLLAAEQVAAGQRGVLLASQAFLQAQRPEKAVPLLEQASRTAPGDRTILFQLGAASERAGNLEQAEKVFKQILETHPDDAAVLNYLGYMWADNNQNLQEAKVMIQKAVDQEPKNGAYVDSLGWVYYRLGDYERAEQLLSEAAALVPDDATILGHLGDVYLRLGDRERAAEQYRRALELDPEQDEREKITSRLAELETKPAESTD
jgi:tetratricopeptide (TPR) repeat protein